MLVVGIAGGVASGKSLVAQCFNHFGARILDADQIGHEVLKQPETIKSIVDHWNDDILKDGEVDRSALAKIVFDPTPSGTKALQTLEQITHPQIGARIREQLSKLKTESNVAAVVLDAPVMFKANWDQMCDKIVFVHAEISIRQSRARQRGWDENEISKRELQQISIVEKRSKSTDVIDNSSSRESTYSQAQNLWVSWGLVLPKQLLSPNTLFSD